MHEQIMDWLNEAILPHVKQASDAQGVILKFARKKQLAPAQLEALCQNFNKAATLGWLKSAEAEARGASFTLIDVPDVVREYLESDEASEAPVKQASTYAPEASYSLVEALYDEVKPAKPDDLTDNVSLEKSAKIQAKTAAARFIVSAQELQEKIEDLQHDLGSTATKLAYELRRTETPFAQVEADMVKMGGTSLKPSLDRLASLVKSARGPADRLDHTKIPAGLVNIEAPLYKLANTFAQNYKLLRELQIGYDAIVKQASIEGEGMASPAEIQVAMDALRGPVPEGSREPLTEEPETSGSWLLRSPTPGKGKDQGKGARPDEPLMRSLAGASEEALKPYQFLYRQLQGVTDKTNRDQMHVDASMDDARSVAMLQNLLTTDSVLREADPQQVIDTYNTIRQLAPDLASDPNIMRVTLRSALQHEGMSVFDVKQFLDTQAASQKTQLGQATLNDIRYKGAPAPRPKPINTSE